MSTNLFRGLTREELEAQYFLRGTRPNYETVDVPAWLERSKRFVESAQPTLDLSYGPGRRNKLDYFSAGPRSKGFVIYIHGGYWQRGDKSVYSFMAEPLVRRGYSVALMNYHMCPEVRISEIAPQARLAVAWLWRNAEELNIRRDNFNVMGHSAGGHLTVEMLFTDWPSEAAELPRDLLHAGLAFSGIFDFEPILYCSENNGLRMDAAEARQVSPIYRLPATNAPQLISYGLLEPPDMHRQSVEYAERFGSMSKKLELLPIPAADHFEVVNVMSNPESEAFSRILEFIAA